MPAQTRHAPAVGAGAGVGAGRGPKRQDTQSTTRDRPHPRHLRARRIDWSAPLGSTYCDGR
eukprot:637334-Rhodomonas_salina.1